MAASPYVQFGCGLCAPATWTNFDAGPAFTLQKRTPFLKSFLLKKGFPDYPANVQYGDVIKGLPVEKNSANAMYSSHVLEHLTLNEFRKTIRNVYSYLKPGGIFRSVLPDLEFYINNYKNSGDSDAAEKFMRDTLLGEKETVRGMGSIPRTIFGRSAHLWMWDYKAIARELEDAGFTDVRRAAFGDSSEPRFADVEDPGRWENCLGFECRKPL